MKYVGKEILVAEIDSVWIFGLIPWKQNPRLTPVAAF